MLESVSWNKKQAAAVLEISRGTLYRKIVEYGLGTDPRPSRNRSAGARETKCNFVSSVCQFVEHRLAQFVRGHPRGFTASSLCRIS